MAFIGRELLVRGSALQFVRADAKALGFLDGTSTSSTSDASQHVRRDALGPVGAARHRRRPARGLRESDYALAANGRDCLLGVFRIWPHSLRATDVRFERRAGDERCSS